MGRRRSRCHICELWASKRRWRALTAHPLSRVWSILGLCLTLELDPILHLLPGPISALCKAKCHPVSAGDLGRRRKPSSGNLRRGRMCWTSSPSASLPRSSALTGSRRQSPACSSAARARFATPLFWILILGTMKPPCCHRLLLRRMSLLDCLYQGMRGARDSLRVNLLLAAIAGRHMEAR